MPLPKLRIILSYGPHGSEHNARHIPAILEKYKPHLYCTEIGSLAADKIPRFERSYEAYRETDDEVLLTMISILPIGREQFKTAEILALKKSPKTRLWFLEHHDAETARKLDDAYNYVFWEINAGNRQFNRGSLGNAELRYAKAIKRRLPIDLLHEEHIIDNAKNALPEILEKYPELENEEEIRVLARLGDAHTKPYTSLHGLKGITVERVFDTPPVYEPGEQWIRRSKFRKKPEELDLDKETLAKDIAADKILRILRAVGAKSPIYEHLSVNLANKLSHKDVEDVAGRIHQLLGEGVDEVERVETAFREKFKEKGLDLPKDEEGANKMFEERVKSKWGAKWQEPYFASDNIPRKAPG